MQALWVHLSHSSHAIDLLFTLQAYEHTVQGNFGLLGMIVSVFTRAVAQKSTSTKEKSTADFGSKVSCVEYIVIESISYHESVSNGRSMIE